MKAWLSQVSTIVVWPGGATIDLRRSKSIVKSVVVPAPIVKPRISLRPVWSPLGIRISHSAPLSSSCRYESPATFGSASTLSRIHSYSPAGISSPSSSSARSSPCSWIRSRLFGVAKSIENAGPPCGLSSTPVNLTTTAAAMSTGASVMPTFRKPVWAWPPPSPSLPPHAARSAAEVATTRIRETDALGTFMGSPDVGRGWPVQLMKCAKNATVSASRFGLASG